MRVEYKLVKWMKDGSYKELSITIQPDAVEDFKKMMGWDEEEFANNTIRYPVNNENPDKTEQKPEEEWDPADVTVEDLENQDKKIKKNKKRKVAKLFGDDISNFIRENYLKYKNDNELREAIGDKFKKWFTPTQLRTWRSYNNLKLK